MADAVDWTIHGSRLGEDKTPENRMSLSMSVDRMSGEKFCSWSAKCLLVDEASEWCNLIKNVLACNCHNVAWSNPVGGHVAEPWSPDDGVVHCPAMLSLGEAEATGEVRWSGPFVGSEVRSLEADGPWLTHEEFHICAVMVEHDLVDCTSHSFASAGTFGGKKASSVELDACDHFRTPAWGDGVGGPELSSLCAFKEHVFVGDCSSKTAVEELHTVCI